MAGVTLNDKKLAAEVRTLTLNQIKRVLEGDDEKYKRELVLKLAPTVLPRINEHSGEDGEPIQVTWLTNASNHTLPTEKLGE